MKKVFYYEKSIGKIGIGEDNGVITDVFFGNMLCRILSKYWKQI